jgi:hypothetical protein
LHTTGVLGRLFAESAGERAARPGAAALRTQGVGKLRVFLYATLPQVLPQLMSYTLYRWENNIRAAAVLGVVGAGGLGQLLAFHMGLFHMGKTATVLGAMLLLVALVDGSELRHAALDDALNVRPARWPPQFCDWQASVPATGPPTASDRAAQQRGRRQFSLHKAVPAAQVRTDRSVGTRRTPTAVDDSFTCSRLHAWRRAVDPMPT